MSEPTRDRQELRAELSVLLSDLIRHLVKHDVMEEAGFFEYGPAGEAGWNNDTVVAAMQYMLIDWIKEHWGMPVYERKIVGEGFVPPNAEILRALDFPTMPI